jgi:hypothetical protein
MTTKFLKIFGRRFAISGDDDYLRSMGEEFDPDTVSLFSPHIASVSSFEHLSG